MSFEVSLFVLMFCSWLTGAGMGAAVGAKLGLEEGEKECRATHKA